MQTFTELQERIKKQLEQRITSIKEAPPQLAEAIEYSCLSGGKYLRPIVVYLVGDCLNCPPERLDAAATAIEVIHTYSLVHDDLPCMDDAKLRRGKPSCHEAYDEATAVLVGDALQALAFELICNDSELSDAMKVKMCSTLAAAIGANGMVAGQYLDLTMPESQLSQQNLEHMHALKTGRLISVAAEFGIIASECAESQDIKSVREFAKALGLAYQVQDDVLDCTGDSATLGKPTNQDIDKLSFISIMPIEDAKALIAELSQHAIEQLRSLGERSKPLILLTQQLIERHN